MRTDPADVADAFDAELRDAEAAALDELGPRFNVAPTQPIPVVVQREGGRRAIELHRWGLVPTWAKSVSSAGARYINARSETVAKSSAFRASFLRRRCVIPADGFYEWRREGRAKRPFLIHTPVDAPLAFAGLWSPWRDPASGEWLLSATVVTTAANATVSELHNRMPVILTAEAWPLWIDTELDDEGLLLDLLRPADDDLLELMPVSQLVNNANNEGPALIEPLEREPAADEPALTLFG